MQNQNFNFELSLTEAKKLNKRMLRVLGLAAKLAPQYNHLSEDELTHEYMSIWKNIGNQAKYGNMDRTGAFYKRTVLHIEAMISINCMRARAHGDRVNIYNPICL